MKISECSFCGMLAITDTGACASCAALMTPEIEPAAPNAVPAGATAPTGTNPLQTAEFAPSAFTPPNNHYVPQAEPRGTIAPRTFPAGGGGSSNSYRTPPVTDARCVKCRALVARGQSQCYECGDKKSSPFKKLAVFAILVAVLGFFSFDYAYEQFSPHGTFRKYAKTTGADDSLVYENFVLQGETVVVVDAPPAFSAGGNTNSQQATQIFSFRMIYKKPNISSIEMLRDGKTAFKQVYDGARGWKYINMPPQPAGYQDSDDAFASRKMGLGMDEYEALEFMNEATVQEFGPDNVKALKGIKEFEAGDIKQSSGEKTLIVGKQKHNGKTESSLLAFDQKTGLLLAMIKNAVMGNESVTTIIYFDKYSKFPVKRKGLFGGVEETRILVPTKMTFVTRANNPAQVGSLPEVSIELNVKTVETDAAIENSYFQKQ